MLKVRGSDSFSEMADSVFSFQPITRIWFAPVESVPLNLRNDLVAVKKLLLEPNTNLIELVFTGVVSIYRFPQQTHPIKGHKMMPMAVVELEEYCYSKELDSTLKLAKSPNSESLGITHQIVPDMDVPSTGKLLLKLQFEVVHGNGLPVGTVLKCKDKPVRSTQLSFPISNANSVFVQDGNEALPVSTLDENTIGYVAHSIMTPLYQLGSVTKSSVSQKIPEVNQDTWDWLLDV